MRNFKTHRCPVCNKLYKEIGPFENHMRNEHPGEIPVGWTIRQYVYFIHTGISSGKCRICGKPTGWNESTGKYVRMCNDPACKKAYRDKFMADMRARRGTTNIMEDPKVREKMLMNRRISGVYTFADGGKVGYMGKLEYGFLQMLDTFFRFPSADVMAPSPNRYIYHYENPAEPEKNGDHIYVPDFYIPSVNLEIELKSSKNEHPEHLKIAVVQDAWKDIAMIRNPSVNYIKIYENDYHVFFQVFADLASQLDTQHREPIKYISRSLLSSTYVQHIPDDCLKTIRKYVYKYSEKAVMKAAASESELPTIEDVENPDNDTDGADDSILDAYEEIHESEIEAEIEEETEDPDDEVFMGLNPEFFYNLGLNPAEDDIRQAEEGMDLFNMDESWSSATESMRLGKDDIDTNSVAGKAAVQNSRWRDKLFGKAGGKLVSKLMVKCNVVNGKITISGINCNLLVYRMQEFYEESKLKYIFEYVYAPKSLALYKKKRISRGEMMIDSIYCPVFFALELVSIFETLGARYKDASYREIAKTIYEHTWLSEADAATYPDVDLSPLQNLSLELLDHQKAFIKVWDKLKNRLHMNGYILAFQPGKGKTLTAIGLSECIHASKVYIVCPNNLKDNWALEIKKYYAKYADENLWQRDVCVLGTKYGNPNSARFIITNNESIKLMQSVATKDPNAMLILDESHNFRNYSGTRSLELYKLADTIQSKNVLCMSATPIKAAPSEITPVLRLIDPTFTDEAAQIYARCFALSDIAAMKIIERRFGMIMYRPPVVVDLPPKTIENLPFTIPDESRYYMSTVHDEIIARYHDLLNDWISKNQNKIKEFESLIRKYSMTNMVNTNGYLQWVVDSMTQLRDSGGYHELTVEEYKNFINEYVRPNCPSPIIDTIIKMEQEIVKAARVSMGYAIGEILPPRRAELYSKLFTLNIERFVEMIRNRSKKTVIFSTMVPVVKTVYQGLNNAGVKTVMITGATPNRLAILTQFKEDPSTLVLVATSQTLGVGLTLTEASQMFFFGTPWRSTDFEQACDRIWRIGQTDPVNIWNVLMQSRSKNLSTRMKDILEWSDRMFNAAISTSELTGEDDVPAVEVDEDVDEEFVKACEEALLPIRKLIQDTWPDEPAIEAANFSKERTQPVFVLLTIGSTTLAKLIRLATGDTFSHASISFNPELTPLYSFGTKKLTGKRELGFVIGDPYDYETWGDVPTPYTLYVTYVTPDDMKKIVERLNYFVRNADRMQYSFEGLVRVFLHIKSPKKMRWFCSAFVAELLGIGYNLDKDSTLYRPQNFSDMPNLVEVLSGDDIHNYDPKPVIKMLEVIKKAPQEDPAMESSMADIPVRTYSDTYLQITDPVEMKFLMDIKKIFVQTSTINHIWVDYPKETTSDMKVVPFPIIATGNRSSMYSDYSLALYTGIKLHNLITRYKMKANVEMALIEATDPILKYQFYKLLPLCFIFNGAIIVDATSTPGGERIAFTTNPQEVCNFYYYRYARAHGITVKRWSDQIGKVMSCHFYMLPMNDAEKLCFDSPRVGDYIQRFTSAATSSTFPFSCKRNNELIKVEVLNRGILTDRI